MLLVLKSLLNGDGVSEEVETLLDSSGGCGGSYLPAYS